MGLVSPATSEVTEVGTEYTQTGGQTIMQQEC